MHFRWVSMWTMGLIHTMSRLPSTTFTTVTSKLAFFSVHSTFCKCQTEALGLEEGSKRKMKSGVARRYLASLSNEAVCSCSGIITSARFYDTQGICTQSPFILFSAANVICPWTMAIVLTLHIDP